MPGLIIAPTGTSPIIISPTGQNPIIAFETILFTTVGAGTWTKPEGVTNVTVECWGGGGGGAAGTLNEEGGIGGGGGGYARKIFTYSVASQNISYTVGAGGLGGTSGVGQPGGDSTWNSTDVIARGGRSDNGTGGGFSPTNVGDVTYVGGNGRGGVGGIGSNLNGAGGGGAGSTGDGDSAQSAGQTLAQGTPEFGGAGGEGILFAQDFDGLPGSNYGGGGSGGCKLSGANRPGGNGAQGLIRITYR